MINHKHPDYYRLHLDRPHSSEAHAAYHAAADAFVDALSKNDRTAIDATKA